MLHWPIGKQHSPDVLDTSLEEQNKEFLSISCLATYVEAYKTGPQV